MTQPNPNDTKLEQQKSPSQVAGLEDQVENNLTGSEKTEEQQAEGIEKNLEDAKSK